MEESVERARLDPRQVELMDRQMVEILQGKTPVERLQIGFEMWTFARRMLLSSVAQWHPDWSKEQVEREVARRMQARDVQTGKERDFTDCSNLAEEKSGARTPMPDDGLC